MFDPEKNPLYGNVLAQVSDDPKADLKGEILFMGLWNKGRPHGKKGVAISQKTFQKVNLTRYDFMVSGIDLLDCLQNGEMNETASYFVSGYAAKGLLSLLKQQGEAERISFIQALVASLEQNAFLRGLPVFLFIDDLFSEPFPQIFWSELIERLIGIANALSSKISPRLIQYIEILAMLKPYKRAEYVREFLSRTTNLMAAAYVAFNFKIEASGEAILKQMASQLNPEAPKQVPAISKALYTLEGDYIQRNRGIFLTILYVVTGLILVFFIFRLIFRHIFGYNKQGGVRLFDKSMILTTKKTFMGRVVKEYIEAVNPHTLVRIQQGESSGYLYLLIGLFCIFGATLYGVSTIFNGIVGEYLPICLVGILIILVGILLDILLFGVSQYRKSQTSICFYFRYRKPFILLNVKAEAAEKLLTGVLQWEPFCKAEKPVVRKGEPAKKAGNLINPRPQRPVKAGSSAAKPAK